MEKDMYLDRTYRHFEREVRVADVHPTSTMTLKNGKPYHNFPEGTGTIRATRGLAHGSPFASCV
jgi:hypothetical protein